MIECLISESDAEVMMSDDDARYGATVAKRRLARRLSALRVRAGMSVNEASDKLAWSRGRLNRFEANLWRQPDPSHIRDLARIYGASDAERSELEDLVALARSRMWWHEPDRGPEKVFSNEFPGFENDAARISVYMPLVLPGLLQTPAYIRALLAVGPWPAEWRERAMVARLRRQRILDRADGTAPQLVAVVTEAALRYEWGPCEERQEQAAHLAALGRRAGVELRLLRFSGGPHPGMSSLINIFDFPDENDPSIVYLENDTAINEVTRPDEVAAYQETFARIRQAALSASATQGYLEQLAGARQQAGALPEQRREASR
jgi:transcriptional regulator with XRE-family HTH domain